MARLLLIDELQSTRDGVAEILRRLGHQVEAHGSPDSAGASLRERAPDVIFLAGRATTWSGVRGLEQLRSIHRPPPVVWMDSSPPEFAGKAPEAFLGRPPSPADIEKVLSDLLGEGGPGEWADIGFLHGVSGPLDQFPPIRVLALAHRLKASGRMAIVTDAGRMTIDVDAGRVVRATGFHDLLEFLGLTNGPEEDLGQVLGRAVAAGISADSALNIAGQTLGARLADLLGHDGHVEFDPNAKPQGQHVVLPVTVPRMLTEGLKVSRSIDRIRPLYLGTRGAKVEVRVPHGVGLEQLGLDPVAYRLLRKAQKVPQVDILLKSEEGDADSRILALDLLAALGYLRIKAGVLAPPQKEETPEDLRTVRVPENLRTEEVHSTTRIQTKGQKSAEDPRLTELKMLRDRYRAASAVEILGIEEIAELAPDALDRRFRDASQRFHPDRFSSEPKSFRIVADDLFLLVNQAYETFKDPAILQEAKDRIRATKTGAVFVSRRERTQAKLAFAKGEIHFRARRWAEAYDELSQATKFDSQTWRYKALYLQAGFWADKITAREASEGIDAIVKELQAEMDASENENAPGQGRHNDAVADLLFQLGEIWIRAGDEPRAYRFFERARTANPKHPATLRRLWLKQVRDDGKTTKPTSLHEGTPRPAPRRSGASSTGGKDAKKGDNPSALDSIMGLFGKKK